MSKSELIELLNNKKGLSIIELEVVAEELGVNVGNIRERHMKLIFDELVASVRAKLQEIPEGNDRRVRKALAYLRRKVSV